MTITVMPCPFCGHDDVELDEVDVRCFAVCCPECEAIGPISRESIEDAIGKWNAPHDQSPKMDRLVRAVPRSVQDSVMGNGRIGPHGQKGRRQ